MDADVKKIYDINGNGEKTDDSSVIPVNTRCIGKPSGIYILYIEDYVHTYIRKILSIKYYANLMNPRLALYGKKYQSEWQIILVIFGAAVLDEKDSKELIQNTIIIAIGNLGTKIIFFLLLPLYTSLLSTKDYGTYDLLITYASFIVPLITFLIEESIGCLYAFFISVSAFCNSLTLSTCFV